MSISSDRPSNNQVSEIEDLGSGANNRDWVFVYGPPGSGKSALGKLLGEDLNLPFYDLDENIVQQASKSIPEIFASEGQAGFRARESQALADLLDNPVGIVAVGGGGLLDSGNRSLVEKVGTVLCLGASFDTLLARTQLAEGERPLLAGEAPARLQTLLNQRQEHYASFPMQLDTDVLSLEAASWDAQVQLGMFCVSGMGAAYDVRVRTGGLDTLGQALLARRLPGPLALVTDENVGRLHAGRALRSLHDSGYEVVVHTIPAGESHKNMDTIMGMWDAFLGAGVERRSTIIALGGGVVGDLAGFAAATYLRSVRWVVIPTTLLAMCDASLGGKTGADLPQGKNLVGAFHPPSLVLADPQVLSTLPEVELTNGLAEVIKHGVLADPKLFELCSQGWDTLTSDWDEVVRRAMAVKIQVIEEDPFERGRRAALNLGHTLGHALELASDFRLKHGEGVAIGMVAAARLAERKKLAAPGLADVIAATLQRVGLPVEIPPGLDQDRVLRAMRLDKKRAKGEVRFVLPVNIGEARWGIEVADLDEIFA